MKYLHNMLAVAAAVACCQVPSLVAEEESSQAVAEPREIAVMETSKGTMTFEFWEDVAPGTVANFKKLAKEGFYDGTAFHRIIDGFMVQGGDPLTKDPANKAMYGTGDPGYKIKAEFNKRPHVRGVLSMARSSDPDSAGSQFFIMLAPTPHLDGQYTAFGRLIKGDDTLSKIARTPVEPSRNGEPSSPVERVEIKSLKIVTAGDAETGLPEQKTSAQDPEGQLSETATKE